MELAKKIWYIFDRKQKIRLLELFILLLIGTALETVGVTAIIPFVSAIMYPEKILGNEYAAWLYEVLGLHSEIGFIVFLSLAVMLVYIIKNAFLGFMYSAQFRFIFNNQRRMAKKLLTAYLQEPYTFHLQHNSAELIHNINADVDTFFNNIVLYRGHNRWIGVYCIGVAFFDCGPDNYTQCSVSACYVCGSFL